MAEGVVLFFCYFEVVSHTNISIIVAKKKNISLLPQGPAKSYAAHCLSLGQLRDKPTSRQQLPQLSPRGSERRNKMLTSGASLEEGARSVSRAVAATQTRHAGIHVDLMPIPFAPETPTKAERHDPPIVCFSSVGGAFNYYPLAGDEAPIIPAPEVEAMSSDEWSSEEDLEEEEEEGLPIWAQPEAVWVDGAGKVHAAVLAAVVFKMKGKALVMVSCKTSDVTEAGREEIVAAVKGSALFPSESVVYVCDTPWTRADGLLKSHSQTTAIPRVSVLAYRFSSVLEGVFE